MKDKHTHTHSLARVVTFSFVKDFKFQTSKRQLTWNGNPSFSVCEHYARLQWNIWKKIHWKYYKVSEGIILICHWIDSSVILCVVFYCAFTTATMANHTKKSNRFATLLEHWHGNHCEKKPIRDWILQE